MLISSPSKILTNRCNGGAARLNSSRGSVIIEFILVCPILLTFIGYSLSLTQLLQANQIALALSREAATEAFRQCVDLSLQNISCASNSTLCMDLSSMQTTTTNCLQRLKTKYTAQWSSLQPSGVVNSSFSIDLEVYRYDMNSVTLTSDCSSQPTSTRMSRITSNNQIPQLFTSPDDLTSLCQRNRVARARVAFKLSPTEAFLKLNNGAISQTYDIIDDSVV